MKKFEEQIRHELKLAASLGGKEGSCGSHDSAPAELIAIQGAQPVAGEMVELAGD
jgi:hypothetical protein